VRASRRGLATVLVVFALLGYPLAVVAGGSPTFPGGREECARIATGDGQGAVELVFGHLTSVPDANALRARLVAAGFTSVWVEEDGCGLWKVTDDASFDSLADGVALAARVRAAGFPARVELDPEP
jgi:hypothetical protein